jgi:hypothetical protein
MVKNIISISEREDRIVNIVKAKFGLKNKNQAIGFIIQQYGISFLEPSLQQIEKPQRKKAIKAHNLEEVKEIIKD